ncbi:MAG: hypothetical protein M3Z35_05385, partial [Nitrospirota bacterium]|nr:hypothetical protein [Nitrospirota bacterium]
PKRTAEEMGYGGARIIAFVLVAGGALGILNSVSTGLHTAHQQQSLRVISAIISAALFAWGILTGIALWRATPHGFKWAKILFALQVPVFSAGRLVYEFSTLLSLRVMIGNTSRYVGGDIGSSSTIYLSSQSLGFLFGLNIVAVLALVYLIRSSRSTSRSFLGSTAAG